MSEKSKYTRRAAATVATMGVSMSEPRAGGGVREASGEAAHHDHDEEKIEHRGFPFGSMTEAHRERPLPGAEDTTQLSCRGS
jgi:hypothetical protein